MLQTFPAIGQSDKTAMPALPLSRKML